MLPVRTTPRFRLDVARAKRRGADPRSFRAFIEALADGTPPPYESRPVPGETRHLRVCGLPGFGNLLYRHTGREVVLIRLFPSRREHRPARPAVWQRRPSWQASPLTHAPIMLKNYASVALRAFLKHKGFALINLLGLSVGLACCLLIFLFVQHERSFDDFHERGDRIYRLVSEAVLPGTTFSSGYTSARYAPMFAEDLPEIVTSTRLTRGRSGFILSHGGRRFEEPGLLFADSTLFDVFTFPLLKGDARTALAVPYGIVLTERLAHKYFGDADPMGQPLQANGTMELTVTGIMADVPPNSHLRFDGLISMTTAEQMNVLNFEDLLDFAFASYLLTDDGVTASELDARMVGVLERRLGEQLRSHNLKYTFNAEALRDVYLHSDRHGLGRRGNLQNLYLFSSIALFILLIACINFMNLATARSAERAREVGVRKVVGAHRGQLAWQFLGESILTSLLAMGLALLLAALFLPAFGTLAGQALSMSALGRPRYVAGLLAAVLCVGLMAGSYPALVLSGFQPAQVLKGRFLSSRRGGALRKGLVVLQFAISVTLLIGTGIIHRQLQYMQRQRLGFRTEQMLAINFRGDEQVQQRMDVIKQAFLALPGVAGVTASSYVPGMPHLDVLTYAEMADGGIGEIDVNVNPVDFEFIDEYGLGLLAGRNFTPGFATDSTDAVVINEATVKLLGYTSPGEALGKTLRQWGQEREVIGVVRDFHFTSLRNEIAQMNFLVAPSLSRYLTVRVETGDLVRTLAGLEQAWARLAPQRPFNYQFLDDAFNAQYQAEERMGRIVGTFTLLAILVACLGLFGLASFTVQLRTKEIGVRKVLGASVGQIVVLLSRDFVRLVGVAFVLATPLAYFAMRTWLDDFAYRTTVEPGVILLTGLLSLGIALLTVSVQSIRAAVSDPVNALRHE